MICFLLPCGFDGFTRGPLLILWAQWDCLMFVSIVFILGASLGQVGLYFVLTTNI